MLGVTGRIHQSHSHLNGRGAEQEKLSGIEEDGEEEEDEDEEDVERDRHTHCGTSGDSNTAKRCLAMGFSEGNVVVPPLSGGESEIRVVMFYTARGACIDSSAALTKI